MNDFVPAQTSVPDWLMTYCRQLADVHHGRRLNRMYVFMLEGFLKVEPWKANPPLEWRKARIHGSSGLRSRAGADQGWVPMNMMLPVDLSERIRQTIESINLNSADEKNVSLRTFLFTVVYWWCTYIHPYKGQGLIAD
jgi:hypothetical protein